MTHLPPLTAIEARVLATLMEKARTVPDSYPLAERGGDRLQSENHARPVMNLGDAQVQEALDALKLLSLVFETSGSRTTRYEHNFQRGVGVPSNRPCCWAC